MRILIAAAMAATCSYGPISVIAAPLTVIAQGYYGRYDFEPMPTGPYHFTLSFTIDTDESRATDINNDITPYGQASQYLFEGAPYAASHRNHTTDDDYQSANSVISIYEDGGFYGDHRDVVRLYGGNYRLCFSDGSCTNPDSGEEIFLEIGMPSDFTSNSLIPDNLNFDGFLYAGITISSHDRFTYQDGVVANLSVTPAEVPLPAAFWLLGSGCMLLFATAHKKRLIQTGS